MTDEQPRTDGADEAPDWAAYYRHTLGREARPLFARGMGLVGAMGVESGQAIEVGFGDGTETLALLADGWQVLAIDPTLQAAEVLRSRVPPDLVARLEVRTTAAQDLVLPPFDLLYAGYALSFVAPAAFPGWWAGMRAALRSGGYLVVNVFGDRDTWADDPAMTFVDRATLLTMLDGLEILDLAEEDADGPAFSGPKHWHVFDVVARRPAG